MATFTVISVATPDQILAYQSLYERESRLPIDAEYIKNTDAYLIYKDDVLIAAFCLNNGNKIAFRYLSIFTEDAKKQVLDYPFCIKEKSLMEIAAIVMTDESSRKDHNTCYAIVLKYAFLYAIKHKKTRVLGGSVIPKIQKIQFELMPHLLYKAPIDESLKIINNARGMVMLYYANRFEFVMRAMYLLCKKQILNIVAPKKPSKRPEPTLQPV